MQKAQLLSVVRSLNQVESKTIKHFKCHKGLHYVNIEMLSCKFICKDHHHDQMFHFVKFSLSPWACWSYSNIFPEGTVWQRTYSRATWQCNTSPYYYAVYWLPPASSTYLLAFYYVETPGKFFIGKNTWCFHKIIKITWH